MRNKTFMLYFFVPAMFFVLNLVSCSSGGDENNAKPQLKIFVTSAGGSGNLSTWADAGGQTGVAAGDAICQAAADRAGLSGTFRAWLSDSTTDAYCHVQGLTGKKSDNCGEATLPADAGPWFRVGDSHPFSDTLDKLINDGQVFVPVYYDENGAKVTTHYYTGTSGHGVFQSGYNCGDWTSSSSGDDVTLGNPLGTTNRWTYLTTSSCGGNLRLLCMQTGTGRAVPALTPPANSKKVFITVLNYSGNFGGTANADVICQNRASALSLANADKYKAWLSTGAGSNAVDRFASDGPWYRLDGVKVADNKADLTDEELFTSINYTGSAYTDTIAWTGTGGDGLKLSPYCLDWTSNASDQNGTIGSSTRIDSWWTEWPGGWFCNSNAALYCFEDE